jgi:hypothetical protein
MSMAQVRLRPTEASTKLWVPRATTSKQSEPTPRPFECLSLPREANTKGS